MRELALFAGAGGGILGGRLLGWRTVCAVEIDPFCREVLLRRQVDGCLPRFPIWDDARTFNGREWRGFVDVITAGFPCQPFSCAGTRLGENDRRNMWPETARIISEVEPRFVLLENVPGIRRYLPVVIRDLRRLGYRVGRPTVIAAASVGAGHIRRRVWIFANGDRKWKQQPQRSQQKIGERACYDYQKARSQIYSDTESVRQPAAWERHRVIEKTLRPSSWWAAEPRMDRVVYGLPFRVDRIRALGNAQVPAVVRLAWEILGFGH
jgi:DNA (cytosine-5)-methyltransferase 1